eukprot:g44255.t1
MKIGKPQLVRFRRGGVNIILLDQYFLHKQFSPLVQLIKIPLDSQVTFFTVNYTTNFGVTCKLTNHASYILIQFSTMWNFTESLTKVHVDNAPPSSAFLVMSSKHSI